MRPENRRMQDFLSANGITARAKYIPTGSLKGCWTIYNPKERWSEKLREKMTALGFTDFRGLPLDRYAGNGGLFSVFCRGHYELLEG